MPNIRLKVAATALATALIGAIVMAAPPAMAAVPSNDNFADATVLSGPAGSVTGTTVGATEEPGEPNTCGYFGAPCTSASLWFAWTAPTSGWVTFGTCRTFDVTRDPATLSLELEVYVYTGSQVDNTTLVVGASDNCGPFASFGEAIFNAVAGTEYHIQVKGFANRSGSMVLDYPAGLPTDSDGDGVPDTKDPDTVAALIADPAVAISSGNRKAALSRLDYIESLIARGDVATAVTELNSLRMRTDGCGTKADKNDWITTCAGQQTVRPAIDSLIAALQT